MLRSKVRSVTSACIAQHKKTNGAVPTFVSHQIKSIKAIAKCKKLTKAINLLFFLTSVIPIRTHFHTHVCARTFPPPFPPPKSLLQLDFYVQDFHLFVIQIFILFDLIGISHICFLAKSHCWLCALFVAGWKRFQWHLRMLFFTNGVVKIDLRFANTKAMRENLLSGHRLCTFKEFYECILHFIIPVPMLFGHQVSFNRKYNRKSFHSKVN